jgi:apolipoprotein N-acyltransferase
MPGRVTVVRTRRPLLFGALDRTEDAAHLFNVAVMITPYGTVTTYRKVRLVPVAEYIPLPTAVRRALALPSESGREFTAGSRPTLFELRGGVTFATMICYEDIFPDLARDARWAGAQALIALVDTRMFSATSQSWQHLRRARLTAIAVGLPMLRSTNSGISAVIGATGHVVETLTGDRGAILSGEGAQVLTVPIGGVDTMYVRVGDCLLLGGSGLLVVVAIAVTALRRH